jgi:hypothetical protein
MKLTSTIALALTVLALCVPVAGAAPDGYQPQLQADRAPDGYQPQLQSASGAAAHPDSRPIRAIPGRYASPGQDVGPVAQGSDGSNASDLTTGVVAALLAAFAAVLAIVLAPTIRGRRRLVEAR